MAYENKYRQDLAVQMPEEEKSLLSGLATVAAVGAAGYFAFRSGALSGMISKGIETLAGTHRSQLFGILEGTHRWSEALATHIRNDKEIGKLWGKKGLVMNAAGHATDAWQAAKKGGQLRMRAAADSLKGKAKLEIEEDLAHIKGTTAIFGRNNALVGQNSNAAAEELLERQILAEAKTKMIADNRTQQAMLKSTGYRKATVEDLLGKGYFTDETRVREVIAHDSDFMKSLADKNILINDAGTIQDLRDVDSLWKGVVQSVENDFGLPVVGFNPLRMFHGSSLLGAGPRAPVAHLLNRDMMNPIVTKNLSSLYSHLGKDAIFIGDKLFEATPGQDLKLLMENVYLTSNKASFVADKLRKISGHALTQHQRKNDFGHVFEALHLGKQDTPIDEFDIFQPFTWLASVMGQFLGPNKRMSSLTQTSWIASNDAFGKKADWLVMRKARTWGQSKDVGDFASQVWAGRNSMDDVTTATLFPYTFFERLDAGMAQFGMGLPTQDLGSAASVFGNILKYRVGPAIGGIYGWKYLNYEAEQWFGEDNSPEKMAAKLYIGASVDLAHVRDAMGITDWAKHAAHIFPGGHFISELPIVGNLVNLNESAQELEDYWLNGEDPVRRGRYWPMGNTPWIGGKVDRYEPNWYRKTMSDYQYTDSQYGSKKEYWENAPIPTPRHPLSPFRHFLTDPYHYDDKHYYTRPYPLTGGIPEFEEFPLIGPFINATVGQLLKPQRRMHEDPSDTGPDMRQYNQEMSALGYAPVTQSGEGGGHPQVMGHAPPPKKPYADMKDFVPLPGSTSGGMGGLASPGYGPSSAAVTGNTIRGRDGSMDAKVGESRQLAAYVTASGRMELMSYDENQMPLDIARELLQDQSAQKMGMQTMRAYSGLPKAPVPTAEDMSVLSQSSGDAYYNLTEMAGFYGFSMNTLRGDSGTGSDQPRIGDAGAITSYRRSFYDMDMGGMGGGINEIGRRFIPERDYKKDINPLRNTMPEWLPGPEYYGGGFTTGDPYTKVHKGEMRLPGEGYEAIYDVPEVQQLMQVPEIKAMVDNRVINRGDLYGPMARFRILADVAPYSDQFRQMDAKMSQFPLSEDEKQEIQEIRAQTSERKDSLGATPYRFRYADVAQRDVKVTRTVFDSHAGFMMYTEEYPDNPIKLAGIKVPMGKTNPKAAQAQSMIEAAIRPGEIVSIRVDADESKMESADTYRSIRAVIEPGGNNLNRRLLAEGLATENESDFSSPAVYARFSDAEIAVGTAWERLTHWDTKGHTKLMQVRSPLEMYKRKDLYGKGYQKWTDPVDDFMLPTYQSYIMMNPVAATLTGAFFGSLFGNRSSPFGKVVGAAVGGTLVGGGALLRSGQEFITSGPYIPGRRQDERRTNEYFDMLKFVKFHGLFEQAAELSQDEGFDIKAYIQEERADGGYRKKRKRALEEGKRRIMAHPNEWREVAEDLRSQTDPGSQLFATPTQVVKNINDEINRLAIARELNPLPPMAAKALMYFREAERTIYAYDAGDPISDLMAALPKREREYLPEFIKAPEAERNQIRELVPSYMRRALQSVWGEEVDEKPTLQSYFAQHGLPDAGWEGWRPDVSLEAVKIKYIQREGLDRSEFSVYPQDVKRANMESTDVPQIKPMSSGEVRSRLEKVLRSAGVSDLLVNVFPSSGGGVKVNANFKRDRRQDFEEYMTENQRDIFMR